MTGAFGRRGRPLPAPDLAWERGHTPVAERFGDIYYSRDGGLAESRHVFLAGNELPQAWQHKECFCIAELGFGTGLNFLATWEMWRSTRTPNSRLHYIAVEGFPLTGAEVRDCLAPWDEVGTLARALVAVYPEPQRGFHRVFPAVDRGESGDVALTLLYGDAAEMLGQLEARVDAWFLDGFAPDKNPEMWSGKVFSHVARLSKHGASAATYSVAGAVRRGLDIAGFDTVRAPGFGAKREMLKARFRDGPQTSALQPWFAPAPHAAGRGHAAIIGAGLSGAHTAAALARRGWRTTLIERHDALAAEASGVPRAVMAPRLTAAPALDGRFYAAAWRYALAMRAESHAQVGSLQLDGGNDTARFAEIVAAGVLPGSYIAHVDAAEASDLAGLALKQGGLYFPQGGWQEPRKACGPLTAQTQMRFGVAASALTHTAGRWRVDDAAGHAIADADVVILGNALGLKRFRETAWLPLEARRGQLTLAPTNARAEALRTILLYGGFLTPAHHGVHELGATFDMETGTDVRASDHQRNLDDLARIAPDLFDPSADFSGFAAVRCMSPDHLPMVGPVPEHGRYLEDFASLRHGHPWARYPDARYHSGLYVLTALGARGAVSAPLAAELLACHITGEPWPLERDLVTALHPARFLVRELKRREI
ncbi:MAG: bifunctional tRNA (5-methylaminomethyl-2-thiouridine)(34)-methyltransferase MnmD/FAD-dependent 5-carboxymethylaminomethyl-2-thiouridine(34) oxidoreductase MnmC [Proteobacteria bacterium]|nr:bifunctional tRNA (5-methylaminomethyl-2-thiouridine)(34)-methyltransferase MnmD/FAD-dependent 5-carboxymethylaminomethyl-2-thiouridine(34) oxidoreductase MnmC [Pseudomonadota bacterium]